MFYLDLDELDSVAKKILLFGHNQKNIYSFRDADHEPAGENPLKERVVAFLRERKIDLGPFGRDPIAIRVGRMTVAIRRKHAAAVRIVPLQQ